MFLRLFVFIPAIGAAFSATIIALTAITVIKPPGPVVVADDMETYILGPLARSIIEKATEEHLSAMNASIPKPPTELHLHAVS